MGARARQSDQRRRPSGGDPLHDLSLCAMEVGVVDYKRSSSQPVPNERIEFLEEAQGLGMGGPRGTGPQDFVRDWQVETDHSILEEPQAICLDGLGDSESQ